jgi:hypothetical protein
VRRDSQEHFASTNVRANAMGMAPVKLRNKNKALALHRTSRSLRANAILDSREAIARSPYAQNFAQVAARAGKMACARAKKAGQVTPATLTTGDARRTAMPPRAMGSAWLK